MGLEYPSTTPYSSPPRLDANLPRKFHWPLSIIALLVYNGSNVEVRSTRETSVRLRELRAKVVKTVVWATSLVVMVSAVIGVSLLMEHLGAGKAVGWQLWAWSVLSVFVFPTLGVAVGIATGSTLRYIDRQQKYRQAMEDFMKAFREGQSGGTYEIAPHTWVRIVSIDEQPTPTEPAAVEPVDLATGQEESK